MSAYYRSVIISDTADKVFQALTDGALEQSGIGVKTSAPPNHSIVGNWTGAEQTPFVINILCFPASGNTAILSFSCDREKKLRTKGQQPEDPMLKDAEELLRRLVAQLGQTLGAEIGSVDISRFERESTCSFNVFTLGPIKKRVGWTVTLTDALAVFHCQDTGDLFCIPRDKAREKIVFLTSQGIIPSETTSASVWGMSFGFGGHKKDLTAWFFPISVKSMKSQLRSWAFGLIAVGVISLVMSNYLDPTWGIVIIVLGLINLCVTHRVMFILNGLALIAVGVMNIFSGITASTTFWAVFGIMQIGMGIGEFKNFGKYQNTVR